MKLCFHHQSFDADVSSGTDHARHQWHELAMAYSVTELAVINETAEPYSAVNESLPVTQYAALSEFIEANESKRKPLLFVEQGASKTNHQYGFKSDQWIVIGGAAGLPMNVKNADYIRLNALASLYPREAAAIVLDSAWGR